MTQQLEERVARLELIMQRWKFTAMVALLVMATVCVAILLKERTKAEVRARAFLLVNDSGELIARLADSPGGPVLLLHAKQANASVMVGSFYDDAGLGVVVQDQTRINLAVGHDGLPGLGIADAKGRTRLMMGLARRDSPVFVLRDETGRPRLMTGLGHDSMLRLTNHARELAFSLPKTEKSGNDAVPKK